MAKASPAQTNFTGGEFSPLTIGRVDSDRYGTGLSTCLNFKPMLQGGLPRRDGTHYVAPTKSAGTKKAFLARFEFSTVQAYLLEFTDQYLRFYKNRGAILETAQNISAITKANPAVLTYVGADNYANGDEIEITGVVGMTQVNGRRFTVAGVNTGANTFQLSGVNSTSYSTYSSGGTISRVYGIATPYLEADLFQLRFVQSADTLYIAHPLYATRKLTRTAHTAWALTVIAFADGPYLATNVTGTTVAPSATTGAITLTASAALWVSTDVGRSVRVKHGATWGYAVISGYTSTTVVNATVINAFGAATAQAAWRLGVWSTTTGFPAAVTFHDDRLVLGGPTAYPQRIDLSNSGDYENFAPSAPDGTVIASNAIAVPLNSREVNNIRWLESDKYGLWAGTVGAEWVVTPSSSSEVLSSTNIRADISTNTGSADIQPVRAGRALLMVQRYRRKINEMSYYYEVDGYRVEDMTKISEHITGTGITQLTYQQEPQSTIWATRDEGVLLSLTYERNLDHILAGWARHLLGGVNAKVESVASVPSPDGNTDDLWHSVSRTIGGNTVRYIEYSGLPFNHNDAAEEAYFVDCGLVYSGSATATIGGLWHLEGQTVSVYADAQTFPDAVVSSGQITLSRTIEDAAIGFGFLSEAESLAIQAGAADGTAIGKTKRVDHCALMLDRTGVIYIGRRRADGTYALEKKDPRTFIEQTDASVFLFTGVLPFDFPGDYDLYGKVLVRAVQPNPCTILAIAPQLVTQDRG